MSVGRLLEVPFFGHIRRKEDTDSLTQVMGTRAEERLQALKASGLTTNEE